MTIYLKLFFIGIISIAFQTYLSFQMFSALTSFLLAAFTILFSLLITSVLTQEWIEKKKEKELLDIKKRYNMIVKMIERENDTASLEKAIREGTRTLIKNAVDYFKLENIKKEIGTSAALENLQLDEYYQIIELLTDFSFILPIYEDNMNIVKKEIEHQIAIYQIDQKDFATFLERIMEAYEKVTQEKLERLSLENFRETSQTYNHVGMTQNHAEKGKRLYDSGNYNKALTALNDAVKFMPNSSQAYYYRALVYHKLKDNKLTEKDLREAAFLGSKRAKSILSRSRQRKRESSPTKKIK